MTFYTGSDYMYSILEIMINALIAETSWSDADLTWTTANYGTNECRRVVKHTDDIWIAFEVINTNPLVYSNYRANGLRVTFSQSWNDVEHTYPLDNMQTYIQILGVYSGTPSNWEHLQNEYLLWVANNGLSIMCRPESGVTNRSSPFFLGIERSENKEYQDSFSNFFCYNKTGYLNYNTYDEYRTKNVIRPFNFEANGITSGYQSILPPIRNKGDGKGYMIFPIIHNSSDNRSPIYQSTMFFNWEEGYGMVTGDVLKIDGDTKEYYLCEFHPYNYTDKIRMGIQYHD